MGLEYIYVGVSASELERDMAKANDFTLIDLDINRKGKISDRQMLRLALRVLKPVYTALAAFAIWMVTLLAIRAFAPSMMEGVLVKDLGVSAIGIGLGAAGAAAIALLRTSRLTLLLLIDLAEGRAAVTMGRVAPSWEERTGSGIGKLFGLGNAVYHYCMKDARFEVRPQAHSLLVTKYDSWRPLVKLYHTPRSKLLLSVEGH